MESSATPKSKSKIFSVSRPSKEHEEMVASAEFVQGMTNGKQQGLSEFIGFLFDFWKSHTLGSKKHVRTIQKSMVNRDTD